MKTTALRLLVCPICASEFELSVTTKRGAEIIEGDACLCRVPAGVSDPPRRTAVRHARALRVELRLSMESVPQGTSSTRETAQPSVQHVAAALS
jgi:uncharacterized protein YbaR (Trm112 family)